MPSPFTKSADSAIALATSQGRSASSADYLADNMGKAPVLMIPARRGIDNAEERTRSAGTMGSIIQRPGALC